MVRRCPADEGGADETRTDADEPEAVEAEVEVVPETPEGEGNSLELFVYADSQLTVPILTPRRKLSATVTVTGLPATSA